VTRAQKGQVASTWKVPGLWSLKSLGLRMGRTGGVRVISFRRWPANPEGREVREPVMGLWGQGDMWVLERQQWHSFGGWMLGGLPMILTIQGLRVVWHELRRVRSFGCQVSLRRFMGWEGSS